MKAVLTVIGKLSDRTINGELLKYLAKTSNDEQPGIRTNTTICLGKIAKNLGVSTRSKVLVAAFCRSLRDPFVHARNAALMALAATADVFSDDDCANRILPAICPALIDKEKLVRDQSNKTLDLYLSKIRKSAAAMADTILPPSNSMEASTIAATRTTTPHLSEAASWTGWAISSFTNKISAATGDMQITSNGGPPSQDIRSNSAPQMELRKFNLATASASPLHRQAVASPPLTSARTSTSSNTNDYFQDASEVSVDDLDAWGELEEDSFDAPSKKVKSKSVPAVLATPFDDNGEPDFAGWLVSQTQKKPGGKALPKGLARAAVSTSTTPGENGRPVVTKTTTTGSIAAGVGVKKAAMTAVKAKPVVPKKIDTTPKDTANDDGWGDGW